MMRLQMLRWIACVWRGHAVSEVSFGKYCDRCHAIWDWRVPRVELTPEHEAILRTIGWSEERIQELVEFSRES